MASSYMEWAKTAASARFNLATSGLENFSIKDLPVSISDLEINGPSLYGYGPLLQALADKFGTEPDSIVFAQGASMANHLAMAAVLEPGDEVLIERPAYDPLIAVAHFLGATVKRFERRFEAGFGFDVDEVANLITDRTRLIVITNLHNPSSVLTDEATMRAIGAIAAEKRIRVLVDEVYLETVFDNSQRSVCHLGRQFIATSSLTKAYGLSGLRCGWIIAEPELAKKMWRLNDLFGVVPAHPAELFSVIALRNLEQIKARARSILEKNRPLLQSFLNSQPKLSAVMTEYGTTVFPLLVNGNAESFCNLLREKYDTTVVPGHFFEMPNHFRIGIGGNSEVLASGLERLGLALDKLS